MAPSLDPQLAHLTSDGPVRRRWLVPTALTTVSKDGTERIVAGEWAVQCGGAPDGFAEGKLTIVGEDVETFALPAAGS